MVSNKERLYFLDAVDFANRHSRDLSTKVGALVVRPDTFQILVTGYNGFPMGVEETPERKERPTKYLYTEHAERNAINFAARHGIRLEGAIMFATLFPCGDCARGIIQSGIVRVISPEQDNDRWVESSKIAYDMFREAGVIVDFIERE